MHGSRSSALRRVWQHTIFTFLNLKTPKLASVWSQDLERGKSNQGRRRTLVTCDSSSVNQDSALQQYLELVGLAVDTNGIRVWDGVLRRRVFTLHAQSFC